MIKKISLVAAASVLGSAAFAQSMPAGVYVNGFVQVERLTSDGDSDTYGIADITIGYDGSAAGSMPIGFELDVYSIENDDLGLDPSITGSVFYDASFGRISVGLPRAALDDYVSFPSFGNLKILNDFDGGLPFHSAANYILKTSSLNTEFGVRFDGSFGGADYGVSYSKYEQDVASITAGASYAFGEYYTVSAGIEVLEDSGSSETGYSGALVADYGNYGGGIYLGKSAIPFVDVTSYAVDGFYQMGNFEVSASAATYGNAGEIYATAVEYSFLENGYIGGSYARNGSGSREFYGIYAGWNLDFGG